MRVQSEEKVAKDGDNNFQVCKRFLYSHGGEYKK